MTNRTSLNYNIAVITGLIAFISGASTVRAIDNPVEDERRSMKQSMEFLQTSEVSRANDRDFKLPETIIVAADSGSRFSGVKLLKKDDNKSDDKNTLEKSSKESSPDLASGDSIQERNNAAADESGELTEEECDNATSKEKIAQGDGLIAENDMASGKQSNNVSKCSSPKNVATKKSKSNKTASKKTSEKDQKSKIAVSDRDAIKTSKAGLKWSKEQMKQGISSSFDNMKKAMQAADGLAPQINPTRMSEDHLDLGPSDTLGE